MPLPTRHSLAVIGAGPIGLETALAALDLGLDVHVFEQGEVGSHPLAWGHVRMFTPWRMNVGPAAAAHLARAGWTVPDPDFRPTGREYAEQYLGPIAALPELKDRVHANAQVVHIGRAGALKGDLAGSPKRREHPFRLLVRDPGGRESFLHAFAVIDASGACHMPNRAGDGGIPARGELYLAPQLSYRIPDVLGGNRATYAGRRTLVIGGGASAATSVTLLAELAKDEPGTRVVWATRADAANLPTARDDDPLPARAALHAGARALAAGSDPAVTHVGGVVVDGFEFNSATHRYRATLIGGATPRVEEVDQVIVNTGFGPDDSIYRELQVREDPASRSPAALAEAMREAAPDCVTLPVFGADALRHPEPEFFVIGHKAFARTGCFLVEAGFRQAADVVGALARDALAAAGT